MSDARDAERVSIALVINEVAYELDVATGRTLAELLRDDLALTGTKAACGEGTCGSCTVLLDDRPVLSCLTLAGPAEARASGRSNGRASCSNHCGAPSCGTMRFSAASAPPGS